MSEIDDIRKRIELKSCPFCGAAANQPYREKPPLGKAVRPVWEISCGWYCIGMRRGSRKRVVADWNMRKGGEV